MPVFLKWLGRIIFVVAGILLIVSAVVTHSPKLVACIITGAAAIAFAIYATVRGLAGGARADEDTQALLGLISPDKWYDWVVFLGLVAICIVAFLV